jgi:4-amino-4-deoxy-L-arabinose transferase-like glycosyltransferase
MIWSVFTVAFFSASSSKLPSYILPVFPALALLIAKTIEAFSLERLRIRLIATSICLAIFFLVIFYMAYQVYTPDKTPFEHLYSDWILAAVAVMLTGTVSSLWWLRKNHRINPIITFAIAGTVASHTILVGHNVFAFKNSSYELVEKIRPELTPVIPFYSVKMYDQTLPFYLNRTVTLVAYWDEFSYGLKQEPQKSISSMEAFNKIWLQNGQALAIMQTELYRELASSGKLPMQLIFNDGHRAVVKKPPK